jgi:hypothetical protein
MEPAVLYALLRAKQLSDQKQYGAKADILRKQMQASPKDWLVDDPKGKYMGLTHTPTKFKIHTNRRDIPIGVLMNKQAGFRELLTRLSPALKEAEGIRSKLKPSIADIIGRNNVDKKLDKVKLFGSQSKDISKQLDQASKFDRKGKMRTEMGDPRHSSTIHADNSWTTDQRSLQSDWGVPVMNFTRLNGPSKHHTGGRRDSIAFDAPFEGFGKRKHTPRYFQKPPNDRRLDGWLPGEERYRASEEIMNAMYSSTRAANGAKVRAERDRIMDRVASRSGIKGQVGSEEYRAAAKAGISGMDALRKARNKFWYRDAPIGAAGLAGTGYAGYEGYDRLKSADVKTTTTHTKVMKDGRNIDILALNDRLKKQKSVHTKLSDIPRPDRSKRTGYSKKRYDKVDTKKPVIIGPDGSLVDGRHRYHRANDEGRKKIPAVRATDDDLNASMVKAAARAGLIRRMVSEAPVNPNRLTNWRTNELSVGDIHKGHLASFTNKADNNTYISSSRLSGKLRGMGYGKKMYGAAIRDAYRDYKAGNAGKWFYSDRGGATSDDAAKVWTKALPNAGYPVTAHPTRKWWNPRTWSNSKPYAYAPKFGIDLSKMDNFYKDNVVKSAVVKQVGSNQWVLYTKDGKRILGKHKKPQDAYKQEYAIQKSIEKKEQTKSAFIMLTHPSALALSAL